MSRRPASALLIGGDGYIGRSLRARLLELNYAVHTLGRGNQAPAPSAGASHSGGLENVELLAKLLPDVDCVVHLASGTTPSLSQSAPTLEGQLNLAPTLGLIEALQRQPHVRLVYLSSGGAVYGNPSDPSAHESTVTAPLSYYGAGKLAAEVFLRCFGQIHGNRITILRPSNVYGPRQPRYRGFAVIRTMLQHLLDDTVMPIWGDGEIVRDFIYIDDMVDAIVRVVESPAADGIFNVGSNAGHSLNQLARVIGEVAGKSLKVERQPARSIDVQRIVLDSRKLGELTGWSPRIALEDGIAITWNWLNAGSPNS